MSIDRIKGEIVFICDTCDEALESETSDFREANEVRRREGWGARQVDDEWQHLCDLCASSKPR